MIPLIKKVLLLVPNKLILIKNNVNKIIDLPETASKTFTYVMKVTGATTASAAKGSVDFLGALVCQDDFCAFVSAVGVVADSLQVCTSFVYSRA